MLTLVLGVTGGLYIADSRAEQQAAIAKSEAVEQAEMAERAMILQNEIAWRKKNAEQIAAQAAERARLEAEAKAAAERKRAADQASRSSNRSSPPVHIPASCDEYSGNRAIGCALMLEAGFALDQMGCLERLWTKESGWNEKASNPSSGAYGIPQALPGGKMASIADDWRTNPATQIRWGLSYISGRYDTPCGAWNFFLDNNWY